MTATELANIVYEENCPIDWHRIEYINQKYSSKEKLEWARDNVEPFADGCSKHIITRAAKILLSYLHI